VYAYYNRGLAYVYKRDYDRVIVEFTQTIRIDPNYANAKQGLENAQRRGK
jgi:tetratricopeptide (TPR) repeat protein